MNIILPRVDNSDIKQKMAWDICFFEHPTIKQNQSEWMLKTHSKFDTTTFYMKKNRLQDIQLEHAETMILWHGIETMILWHGIAKFWE